MVELDDPPSYRKSGRNAFIRAAHGQILHGKASLTFGNSLVMHYRDMIFESYNAIVWPSSLLMIVHAEYTGGSKLHFKIYFA